MNVLFLVLDFLLMIVLLSGVTFCAGDCAFSGATIGAYDCACSK